MNTKASQNEAIQQTIVHKKRVFNQTIELVDFIYVGVPSFALPIERSLLNASDSNH